MKRKLKEYKVEIFILGGMYLLLMISLITNNYILNKHSNDVFIYDFNKRDIYSDALSSFIEQTTLDLNHWNSTFKQIKTEQDRLSQLKGDKSRIYMQIRLVRLSGDFLKAQSEFSTWLDNVNNRSQKISIELEESEYNALSEFMVSVNGYNQQIMRKIEMARASYNGQP
jgi:hypothetical protein